MAQTNPAIRKALLGKLGVTPQRMYQLVKARKEQLPMTTPQAVYTIAFENGIDIAKHLSDDETAEVRGLVSALPRPAQAAQLVPVAKGMRKSRPAPKAVKVQIAGVDIGEVPALKAAHVADAKKMSDRVYPTIYVFENSVRDLIERVLEAKHGEDWWDKAVPKKVKETAAKHKADEAKDPWHSARGKRPMDYVFLNELWVIIKDNWPDFKQLFLSGQAWVETLITSDMNVSRRVLAHMSPLAEDDIKGIEAAFRKWVKVLEAAEDKLP